MEHEHLGYSILLSTNPNGDLYNNQKIGMLKHVIEPSSGHGDVLTTSRWRFNHGILLLSPMSQVSAQGHHLANMKQRGKNSITTQIYRTY